MSQVGSGVAVRDGMSFVVSANGARVSKVPGRWIGRRATVQEVVDDVAVLLE